MPASYPCLQCRSCKQLFATATGLNSHLDHYIPEYCAATGSQRRTHRSSHPISAIRYIRADATRTVVIRWDKDTVRPPDGVLWSFAVPVVQCFLTPLFHARETNANRAVSLTKPSKRPTPSAASSPRTSSSSSSAPFPSPRRTTTAFSDADEPVKSEARIRRGYAESSRDGSSFAKTSHTVRRLLLIRHSCAMCCLLTPRTKYLPEWSFPLGVTNRTTIFAGTRVRRCAARKGCTGRISPLSNTEYAEHEVLEATAALNRSSLYLPPYLSAMRFPPFIPCD